MILTINSELESAKKLGFPTLTKVDYQENYPFVIRWGNSYRYYNKLGELKDFEKTLNHWKSIRNNVSKDESLTRLSKVVITPRMYKFGQEVPEGEYVYRPIFHSGGIGFQVKQGPFKVEEEYYATEFIHTDTEFRVFFCGDKMMYCKRVSVNPERLNQQYKCRSLWPYEFQYGIPSDLASLVIKAKQQLNLDFGCFDILYKDVYYFLEANTAVTLDKRKIINFYRDGLINLAKEKFDICL